MRFFQKGVNALLIWPIRAEKAIDKLFGKHLLTERDKENINIKELKSGSRRGTISKIISNLAIRLVKKGVWDFICRESASVGSINIGCFKNYQKN